MTQPPFGPDWTAPPPPQLPYGGPSRPIRGRMVAAGIGLALLAHLLTIGLPVGVGIAGNWTDLTIFGAGLVAQLVVFVACLVLGIVFIVRRDRGLGIGLLIGWAVGVIVLPVIGFGACLWALSQPGAI